MATDTAVVYSVLLIDDSIELARLYKRHLENCGPLRVTLANDGRRAAALARRQLFDVLVIDAKLEYRGYEFGGLRLADELRPRYGANSILVISRYITEELMREFGADYEFMEKSRDLTPLVFARGVVRRLRAMRKRQYAFVAMPFGTDVERIYTAQVRTAIGDGGFRCVRIDEVPHSKLIPGVILELVNNSKFVVFIADDANANAYYEAGFAEALEKEVIVVVRAISDLRFDVAQRFAIAYGTRVTKVRTSLSRRIRDLRLSTPPGF